MCRAAYNGAMCLRAYQLIQSAIILIALVACSGSKPKKGAEPHEEGAQAAERTEVIEENASFVDAPEWAGWIINEPHIGDSQFQSERAGAISRAYQWPDSQPLAVSLLFWFGVIATLAYIFSRLQHLYRHKHTSSQ